jgi:hypothetical protein
MECLKSATPTRILISVSYIVSLFLFYLLVKLIVKLTKKFIHYLKNRTKK